MNFVALSKNGTVLLNPESVESLTLESLSGGKNPSFKWNIRTMRGAKYESEIFGSYKDALLWVKGWYNEENYL